MQGLLRLPANNALRISFRRHGRTTKPDGLGETLNNRGVKRLFVLAPNYAAGKDMATGVKKTFKGEIVGEEYTGWPGQLDFSAELTKVRSVKPDAVWVFYPGQAGARSCSNMPNRA